MNISSARQSRVPATVRASKQGGSGGAQPPQHCKRIPKRNWIQNATIQSSILFTIQPPKTLKNGRTCGLNPPKILPKFQQKTPKSRENPCEKLRNPGPEAPKSRSGGFWAALGCFLVTRDLPDASGTPSRRLWGGSWSRFYLILAHLEGVLGAQDGPKILPRRPKMPLRCLQDSPRSDFQQRSKEK